MSNPMYGLALANAARVQCLSSAFWINSTTNQGRLSRKLLNNLGKALVEFCKWYPLRCHQDRVSVIKYTLNLQQIRGLKSKNLVIWFAGLVRLDAHEPTRSWWQHNG
jgi:hypothetical protein